MGNSLLEQLKKAGLVDERKAKQVEQEKRKRAKADKSARTGEAPASAGKAAKVARDRALEQQRRQAAAQRALAAQVRQLVEAHRLPPSDGEIAFHFTEDGKVRRVFVTAEQQVQLGKGKLAIVRFDKGYALVPAAAADKIRQRDPQAVVLHHTEVSREADPAGDPNDPYAEFQVPDDLMW